MQSHRRADAGASYMDRARLHSIPDGDCLVWQGSTANGVPRVGRSAADRATSMAPINLRVAVLAEVRPASAGRLHRPRHMRHRPVRQPGPSRMGDTRRVLRPTVDRPDVPPGPQVVRRTDP